MKEFKVFFKDAYGEELQPLDFNTLAQAEREAYRLERLGYCDIEIVGE